MGLDEILNHTADAYMHFSLKREFGTTVHSWFWATALDLTVFQKGMLSSCAGLLSLQVYDNTITDAEKGFMRITAMPQGRICENHCKGDSCDITA